MITALLIFAAIGGGYDSNGTFADSECLAPTTTVDFTTTGDVSAADIDASGDVSTASDTGCFCAGAAKCTDSSYCYDGSSCQMDCTGGYTYNDPIIVGIWDLGDDSGALGAVVNRTCTSDADGTVQSWDECTDSLCLRHYSECNGASDADVVALGFEESAAPDAGVSNFGLIYLDSSQQLHLYNEGGVDTYLGGSLQDARSGLYFNDVAGVTVTISTQSVFTKITSYNVVGDEDPNSNAVGDATTDDDITIGAGAGGSYSLLMGISCENSGAGGVNAITSVGITLASALTITDCTNATPIVVTSASHGLSAGDGVTISGVGGNTACNGDHIIQTVTASTFELTSPTDGSDVAGSGGYTTGGTVDVVFPVQTMGHRNVSNTTFGNINSSGDRSLSAGDTVSAYIVNRTNTDNFVVLSSEFSVHRWKN